MLKASRKKLVFLSAIGALAFAMSAAPVELSASLDLKFAQAGGGNSSGPGG